MRIALVKTSSMGDVIHTYPVVSDMQRALPGTSVHWVVEEAFRDLPGLHPGVTEVVTVAVRRWRRRPFSAAHRAEIRATRARLAAERFDLVLDLQGLIKSACIGRWADGPRAGYAWACAREPLASLTYQRRYRVDMNAHAIERGRQLAAQACGYELTGLPRFGLSVPGERLDCVPPGDYAVLLHATSREEKRWPADHWRALIDRLTARRVTPLLPWGSDAERAQAEALCAGRPSARVLPRLGLAQCAILLRDAAAVVGVDTGLTHLSAALERPTVALFAATPAWRFGPYWTDRAVSLGSPGVWPDPQAVIDALDGLGAAGPAIAAS